MALRNEEVPLSKLVCETCQLLLSQNESMFDFNSLYRPQWRNNENDKDYLKRKSIKELLELLHDPVS